MSFVVSKSAERNSKIGSRANHFFDTEALAVCGAVMMKLLPQVGEEEKESDEAEE